MNRIVLSIIILAIVFFAGNSIAGDLQVTPEEDFISSGMPGGPFSPSFKDYQLTNNGPNTIWWGVYKTVDWLYVDPDWGPLGPAASTIVTVSLTSEANSLPEGIYTDTLTFLNISSEEEETRDVNLTVELPGGIWLAPDSYNVNLTEGLTLYDIMTIGNDGIEIFDYQIRTRCLGSSEIATDRINKIAAAELEGRIFSVPAEQDLTIAADVPYLEGELLVRFAEPPGGEKLNTLVKGLILESSGGGTIIHDFQIVPGLCLVELPADMTVEQALEQYNNTEGVLYAQPNYEVHIDSKFPNDTRFDELWGMHNTGQTGGLEDADIDAPEAWDISTGSNNIVVAVIDTGVDYTHPDLAENMWINEGEIPGNGIDDDGNGYVDDVYGYDFCNNDGNPMDDNNHGTHCAGTIGGVGNNNQGVVGVCWDVKIMAIKFLNSAGGGWTDDAISSVEYSILMGANLSSNSWGGGSYSQALKDAIDAAGAAGMLFVAAAGNDGSNNDSYPHYPSSYDCESLIAVLSTEKYDKKSGFSNYGPTSVDLGAPGSDILSCKPGNQYQYLDGTSMATPHVAGAYALVWSLNPMLSNYEVKEIILNTVDELDSIRGKCVSDGRLNVYNALLETKVPWLRLEPEEGFVEPNQIDEIAVTFDATEMLPGTYNAEILILTNDPYNPEIIVPVTMTVTPDALQASPEDDFEVTGPRGGPFEPNCILYTLTNIGTEDANWAAYNTESWLLINPAFGLLEPNETIDVNVCFSPDAYLLDPNIYEDTVFFENLDSSCKRKRKVTLIVEPPDSFSEIFDGYNDLTGLTLTFMPDGSSAYYEACRQKISEFPTDPNGGTNIALWDDDYDEITLSDGNEILFYGNWYDSFYIGSNGYITFGEGDTEYEASMENHFSIPRIAGLFTDLNPSNEQNISYKQLDDRIVVTFKDVPLYGDKYAKNSFQIEIYFVNGKICIAWLGIDTTASIAGLSEGFGLPTFLFEQSDLSKYPICWPLGDNNKDYIINFLDFSTLAANWLEMDCTIPYWCGRGDLDFSGAVNGYDFLLFIENWLFENPWWLEPIAHWKFDEGEGDTAYDSTGGNNGTIYGANWVMGKLGWALDFDGIDDYVETTTLDEIDQPISISAWAKTYGADGISQTIFGRNQGDSYVGYSYENWLFVSNESFIYFGDRPAGGGVTYLYSTKPIETDHWYHVVVTRDSNSFATLYLNGCFDNNDTVFNIDIVNVKYRIGRVNTGHYPFNGIIDDVRVYNRVLTDEEVWQLYREGLHDKATNPYPEDSAVLVDPNVVLSWIPGKDAIWHDVYLGTDFNDVNDATPDSNEYQGRFGVSSWDPCGLDFNSTYYWRIDEISNPDVYKGDIWSFTTFGTMSEHFVSWWKFDEGEGDTAYDSAGDNHGTVYGAKWTTGKINGALDFDGMNDYVLTAQSTDFKLLGDASSSMWIKGEVSERVICITLENGVGETEGENTVFYIDVFDESMRYVHEYSSGLNELCEFPGIPADTWIHIVVVRDSVSKTITAYYDGLEVDSISYVNQPTNPTPAIKAAIGARTTGDYSFDGLIDDVRVYDRALTDEEVWQLFREGLGNKAFNPYPEDGAELVDPNVVLSWTPGKDAIWHDVYLGTDFNDVNDATPDSNEYQGQFDVNSWNPCGLDFNSINYWRIDEINNSDVYKGDIWSFTTFGTMSEHFVSWWKFDEGEGEIVYDSAGDNHGTIYGATWTTGKIGWALDFDGIDDYISLAQNAVETTEFTVAAWANHLGPGGGSKYVNIIFSQRDDATEDNHCSISLATIGELEGSAAAGIRSSIGSVQAVYSPKKPYDQWDHYAMTVSTEYLTFYINGIEVDKIVNQQLGDYITSIDYITIGRIRYNGITRGFFNGLIDDVRVYDRALTDEEVWQVYKEGWGDKASNPYPEDSTALVDPNVVLSWTPGKDAIWHDVYFGIDFNDVNNATPDSNEYQGQFDVSSWDPCGLDPNSTYYWRVDEVTDSNIFKGDVWSFRTFGGMDDFLVSWWKFDEGEGNIAYDSIGDNNGTVNGATWTTGQIDGALSFDGSHDYVAVGDKASLELQSFTLSFWSQNDHPEEDLQGGIAKGKVFGAGYEVSFELIFANSQAIAVVSNTSDTKYGAYAPITDSDWHFWSMTVGDGTLSIYKDGVIQDSTPYTGPIDYAKSDNDFAIGSYTDGMYAFDGIIDDVRFYNRALSDEEIWQLYLDGLGD